MQKTPEQPAPKQTPLRTKITVQGHTLVPRSHGPGLLPPMMTVTFSTHHTGLLVNHKASRSTTDPSITHEYVAASLEPLGAEPADTNSRYIVRFGAKVATSIRGR